MSEFTIRTASSEDTAAIAMLCRESLGYACADAHVFYRRAGFTEEKAQIRFLKRV